MLIIQDSIMVGEESISGSPVEDHGGISTVVYLEAGEENLARFSDITKTPSVLEFRQKTEKKLFIYPILRDNLSEHHR